jgi:hypothetical protein
VVLLARRLAGLNVAVVPEYVTDPVTAEAPCVSVKVVFVMVVGSMGALKVAVTLVSFDTFVAAFAGAVAVTVGEPETLPPPFPLFLLEQPATATVNRRMEAAASAVLMARHPSDVHARPAFAGMGKRSSPGP